MKALALQRQHVVFSFAAGVLDCCGGLRVVVTAPLAAFVHHCNPARQELLFIVPDLVVPEPVPWNMIPWLIRRVEHHVREWIRTRNDPDALAHPTVVAYRKRQGSA